MWVMTKAEADGYLQASLRDGKALASTGADISIFGCLLHCMMQRLLAIVSLCLLAGTAEAGVQLTSHSYVHSPSGQIHIVFHLASYKRGLFFGSCGPSTRSLQWEYYLEMKGTGPNYAKEEIEVKDGEYHSLALEAGTVTVDNKAHTARISLTIKQDSGGKAFVGNGDHRIRSGT
jgi:hypothetical protein